MVDVILPFAIFGDVVDARGRQPVLVFQNLRMVDDGKDAEKCPPVMAVSHPAAIVALSRHIVQRLCIN